MLRAEHYKPLQSDAAEAFARRGSRGNDKMVRDKRDKRDKSSARAFFCVPELLAMPWQRLRFPGNG